jgi:hypothetical protein
MSPTNRLELSPTLSKPNLDRRATYATYSSNFENGFGEPMGMQTPQHHHTKTPSFTTPGPIKNHHKPTESHLAKLKQLNGTSSSTSNSTSASKNPPTNTKTLSKSSSQKGLTLDSKKKLENKTTVVKKANGLNTAASTPKNGQQHTLSFYLDQNGSTDDINLNVSQLSTTWIKEIDDLMPKPTSSTHEKGTKTVNHSRKPSTTENPPTNTTNKGDTSNRNKPRATPSMTNIANSGKSSTTVAKKKDEKK